MLSSELQLDWAKKPPSERLRILEEEKLKVQAARAELEGSGYRTVTPATLCTVCWPGRSP